MRPPYPAHSPRRAQPTEAPHRPAVPGPALLLVRGVLLVLLVPLLLGPAVALARGGCPRGTRRQFHVVQKGQTLSEIAGDAGLRVPDLIASNPALNPDLLSEGQKLTLCLPRKKPKWQRRCGGGRMLYEHRVRSGENLAKLSVRYAQTQASLLERNPDLGGDPAALRAGQTITVCTLPMRFRAAKVCGYRTPLHKHEVLPGEWLAEIASRYGVRQKDLRRLNARVRRNPDFLRPGQTIRVCPDIAPRSRERIRHRVRPGQTLASIAKRYGLNPHQLLKFQRGKLEDPDELRVGQRIVVWKDGPIVSGFADEDEDEGAVLAGGIQLPEGPHYVLKSRHVAWGTAKTVRLIQTAAADYRKRTRGARPVRIGDLSRRGGGKFPPHKSHRTGMDVDVGYVLTGAAAEGRRFKRATAKNFDAAGSWRLLRAFLRTGQVRYVFVDYRLQKLLYEYAKGKRVPQSELDELFQYPRGKRRAYGILRDDPGHDDHFHVRFW